MRRTGVFVFMAVGLLLVGALVLWLGRAGDVEGGDAATVIATTSSSRTDGLPVLPSPTSAGQAPESASLEAFHPAVDTVAPGLIPASYRKALGGLTGRVVEHTPGEPDTLRPVAGMTVELVGGRKSSLFLPRDALLDPSRLETNAIAASGVTDADGRFLLEQIEPRTFGALLLDPGGPRGLMWPLEITPVGGTTQDLGQLVLPATATLFGRIVDERGAPVRGARVRSTDLPLPEAFGGVAEFRAGGGLLLAEGIDDSDEQFFMLPPPSLARLEAKLPLPTTYTDAAGQFELTGVVPGLVVLAVDDGLHLPLVRTGVASGAAGGRRDVGSLIVGDGLPLSVTVQTSDGQPVPTAQVFAGSPLPAVPVAIMKTPAERGAEGRARFTGMADGQAWIAARLDEHHDFTILSIPEVSVGEAEITLPTPHALTITVLDENGALVPGAAFYGRTVIDNEMPDLLLAPLALAPRTQARDDGRYVVSDLDPTQWEITTVVGGRPQHRLNADLSLGDTSVEVRLVRGLTATVHVVSGVDQSPVEWAMVEAHPAEDSMDLNLFDAPVSTQRTDAAGLVHFDSLPAGSIGFTINHPGYAVITIAAELPTTGEVLAPLFAGGSVAGQVLDQGAPPAEPVLVMLMPEGAMGDAELPRFVVTDLEGRFRFARVEPGAVQLEARSRMEVGSSMSLFEAMFNSPLAEASTEVVEGVESEVLLQSGAGLEDTETGFVTGQLSVNGAPGAGWKVRTWGRIRRSATTDDGGRFDLGRIEAGDVSLLISAPTQSVGNGFTEQRQLTLQPDEQLWVPIELTTGAVSGRVLSAANGEPLAGIEVNAVEDAEQGGSGRRPGAISTSDGSFTIEPVVSGRYRIRSRADGYAAAISEPIEIAGFQTRTGIVLRLPAALAISGTISLEGTTEQPDWMWLMATGGPGGDGREGARVESGNAYSFDRLGPGDWQFELSTSLELEFESVQLTLTGDVKNLPLVFKPLPPVPPTDSTEALKGLGYVK